MNFLSRIMGGLGSLLLLNRAMIAWYFLGAGLFALMIGAWVIAMRLAPSPPGSLFGMLLIATSMAWLWRWVVITIE